ncbi:hypothetical protein PPYC1_09420 [Paenibacillus polymyxa]|uniref:hypothetical protein n=1 Tax=Paenibacillus TaxID=44249 RepID=UPI0008FC71EE|nr:MULTISPECIES: hypothetical protein [Paenibacillus]APB70553.1 hypothetical protein PPYC1_09420 [Paenibacillus polymyxa]QYK63058.1 hypothetical protein KAI37_03389 [Paenibacillus sp. S25]
MNKPVYKKWWFWAIMAFAVIGGISGGLKDREGTQTIAKVDSKQAPEAKTVQAPSPTEKVETAVSAPDPKKEAADKKMKQQLVSDFEKTFFGVENNGSAVFNKYKSDMDSLGKGATDVLTVYGSTKNAKDTALSIMSQYNELEVPDALPSDVKDLLEQSKSHLATAYYSKSEAFDSVLSYLDEQKPSYMNDFEENIKLADQDTMQGVLKLMQAKEKVGLKITEKKK